MIEIHFPDKTIKSYEEGVTPIEIAQSISEGLARNVLSAEFNGETVEANTPLFKSGNIVLFTWKDKEGKKAFWHSSAHVLAQTILSLYPEAKLTIGPAIENGFYYDVDFGSMSFSENDLNKVEKQFLDFAREKNEFKMRMCSKADALDFYQKENNQFKIELIENLEDGTISFCDHADFTDLCRGGHIPHTGFIKAVKLLSVAGAYWRGDEKNNQLTRLYAISFPNTNLLEDHLEKLEEAKKRDHRKLGKELELFFFSESVGSGLPIWLPNGHVVRENLIEFMRKEQIKQGYMHVTTPHIGSKELYVTSGHYDKYGESSFQPIQVPSENEEYLLKPMNCPHHCEIFKFKPHSYKELPVRIAEFGTVYRYEQSGELHGMTRVRGFTQDDAHIFCSIDQVRDEVLGVMDLILKVFKSLSFKDYKVQISLRDKEDSSKYIGDSSLWDKAENDLIDAVEQTDINAEIVHGEAAFYGPKIDFMVNDSLDREWQLGTIQVDYQLPKRFNLEYIDKDNSKKTPVIIHRAPFGSMERFIAIITEHCEGNFPLWLAPNQLIVLPINEKVNQYASSIKDSLENLNFRTSIDTRFEKISKKIRDAEIKKIPYMIIIGENEMTSSTLSIRKKYKGDIGKMSIDELTNMLKEELNTNLN